MFLRFANHFLQLECVGKFGLNNIEFLLKKLFNFVDKIIIIPHIYNILDCDFVINC